MKTLVLGGTGTTGSRVATLLGPSARVATRKPIAADQVRFDWAEPETYVPALVGIDRIYLVAPISEAEPTPIVEPFLADARDNGVRRVVLLSSSAISEDTPSLGTLQRLVREGFPEWTVLRPSWFMQNFIGEHAVAQGIRSAGEIVTATGSGRVAFVDAGDIAAVAARALIDPLPHNTDHVITGPQALSYADAAEIITEVTGRPVRHRSLGTDELAEMLTTTGLPSEFAVVLAGLDEQIRHGAEDRVTTTVEEVVGRPARTFAEFVNAHRDSWQ
ncbi:NmrA family NAD(P)-binding protein [Amycolatopsis sp. 195334CR]|uniref:NmrA family NAD(P)-binding protein n=1 Tax=Amycolatopsis sp. 195334CR TaxID=2814588 RepID=UPI001A8E5392|nr:NmrA family NAD(P)-binding protein [Amycolatopsis sp. 195334CR]MBN6041316.1 NmrA family NAD(P)-binding protein [Amycolatopsis sp. 195334CR]